jgi:hypothetical protein
VTLLEKLDAIARRYARDNIEPDGFVRHYEDAAQIVHAAASLPELGMTVMDLAQDMVANNDITALPSSNEPALRLDDPPKRAEIQRAHDKIAPMFWGPRVALDESCELILGWLQALGL